MEDKDLLELAKHGEIVETKEDFDPNIQQFIIDLGIIEDPNGCVKATHIHWAYVRWCQFRSIEPLPVNMFGAIFNKKFKKRIITDTYYFVNEKPFLLNDKELFVMIKYYKEKRKNGPQKNKCKTPRVAKTVQQQS